MKKILLLISILIMASMILAACAPAATEAPPEPEVEEPAPEPEEQEPEPEPEEEMMLPDLGGRVITIAVENAYPPFNYEILAFTQEYGLDGFSTPQVLAFAIELYEAGILTDEDLPDFPETGGERFFYLVEMVVNRQGVGDKLANGVYHAARAIGKGAEEYDHNSMKKFEQVPLKLKMINYPYFLMYATGAKMNITQIEGNFPQAPMPTREEREEFTRDWPQVPDERFKEWFEDWELRGDNSIPNYPSAEASCEIVHWQEEMHYIDDCTGMCAGLSSFPYLISHTPETSTPSAGVPATSSGSS